MSATKVPPWKRKQLGDGLNNRSLEFDELLFWKLDRFVRRLSDLSTMIEWSLKSEKNLVSKNDSLDLTTTAGKIMVTIIGGIAEIEAANTSTRAQGTALGSTHGASRTLRPVHGALPETVRSHEPRAHRGNAPPPPP
ncbi:hypothetical protein GCM10010306_015590 [Streptomyces umbrinus]|nr:hypothetical protein GCM10010306_015590 [Streptomyces umbrinus]